MTAPFAGGVLVSPLSGSHTAVSGARVADAAYSSRPNDCMRDSLVVLHFPRVQQKSFWPLSAYAVSAWLRVGALFLSIAALSLYSEHQSTGKSNWRSGDENPRSKGPLLPPFPSPLLFAEATNARGFVRLITSRENVNVVDDTPLQRQYPTRYQDALWKQFRRADSFRLICLDVQAYRKLARQYHPDANEGDKETFLSIARAHEVLRDEEQRKKYDAYGEAGLSDGGGASEAGPGGVPFDFADIFGGAFGGSGDGGTGPNIKFTFTSGDGWHEGFPGGFGNFFPKTGGVREEVSDESLYEDEEDIAELGPQGLQRQLDSRDFAFFLNLYNPRCRPCRQLKPEYAKAAKKFRGIIPFGAVNCSRFKNLRVCREAGHYPSLLLYPPELSGKPVEHRGDRSAAGLVRFLSEAMPSAATVLAPSNFEHWISEHPELPKVNRVTKWKAAVCFIFDEGRFTHDAPCLDAMSLLKIQVALFTDKRGVPPLFKYISYQMRRQLAFGVVLKEQVHLMDTFRDSLQRQRQREMGGAHGGAGKRLPSDIVFPSLLAIDDIDQLSGEWISVQGHVDQELLTLTLSRVAAKARASSGAVFKELTARRMASGECSPDDPQFCFILLVPDKFASRGEPAALLATLHSLAEKFKRDPVKLCWVNKDLQGLFAAAFELSSKGDLAFIAYRPKRKKYELLQGEISTTSLESFIDSVVSGGKQLTRKIHRTPLLVGLAGAKAWAHDEL